MSCESPVHDDESTAVPSTAEALRASEERYRLLVEHAPDAIVILDMDLGRFIDCNAQAATLFETERETLLTYGPTSLSPPLQPDGRPSDEAAMDYIGRCLAGEFPAFEWTHRTVAGRDIACEVSLVRLPRAGRQLLRGSITDISWRKDLERERARLATRLQAAQKLESLGLMAGGIAHDFNNLLSVILGYADLSIGSASLDPPTRQTLERLRKAAVQAQGLTDQLLVYTGQAPSTRVPLDLSALITEELAVLGVAVRRKATLSTDLEPGGPRVAADPGQLQQVVMNLLGNASDAVANPSGHVRLRTSTVEVDLGTLDAFQIHAESMRSGRYALLEVSDTGCGMPEDVVGRIFDPFFTTKPAGHGLGLAAVAGIVRSHGGALRVSSTVGVGSVFAVLLPLTDAPPQTTHAPQAPTLWRGQGQALVVDDVESVREVTQALLEALGFQVLALASGEEAVAAVQHTPGRFRLALLDVTLLGMDGVETRGALQALDPDLRVLLVSGFARDEAVEMLRGEGPVAFLQKPYGLQELRDALESLFS